MQGELPKLDRDRPTQHRKALVRMLIKNYGLDSNGRKVRGYGLL
jgi:hypothetical protein